MTLSWLAIHGPPWHPGRPWDVFGTVGLSHFWVSDAEREWVFPSHNLAVNHGSEKLCPLGKFLTSFFFFLKFLTSWAPCFLIYEAGTIISTCWAEVKLRQNICKVPNIVLGSNSGSCKVWMTVPVWLGSSSFCTLSPTQQVFLEDRHFLYCSSSPPPQFLAQ